MAEDIFKFDGYRQFLKAMIADNHRQKGYREDLASAVKCHRSHISLILSGSNQLTPEQACRLSEFWSLSPMEEEYFLALVDLDRAGSPALTKLRRERMRKLRKDRANLLARIEDKEGKQALPTENYYLKWEIAAIHLLLGIDPSLSVEQVAERLHLSKAQADAALQDLQQMGLLKRGADGWQVIVNTQHAPKGTMGNVLHQINWRHQAASKIPRHVEGDFHYTSLYTISKKDQAVFAEKLKQFIESTRKLVLESGEENLVCFNCDFFDVLG